MKSFSTLWYKPRKIVRYLDQKSLTTQLFLVGAILLSYFIQMCIIILSHEKAFISPLMTLPGLLLIVSTILIMGFAGISFIYAASLAFWTGAQFFKGIGTLPQTRAAVIWTLVWTIPGTLFFTFLGFTLPFSGLIAVIIRYISLAGILTIPIYSCIVLFKSLSEINGFGFWRTLCSVFIGFIILAGIIFATFEFYKEMGLFKRSGANKEQNQRALNVKE